MILRCRAGNFLGGEVFKYWIMRVASSTEIGPLSAAEETSASENTFRDEQSKKHSCERLL